MRALEGMRQAIQEQRYRVSSHGNEEMSEDNLVAEDIGSVVLTGRITRRFTRDLRGTRYEVAGRASDGRRMRCEPFSALGRAVGHYGVCRRGVK